MLIDILEDYDRWSLVRIHERTDAGLVVEARCSAFPYRYSVYRRVRPGFVVLDTETHDPAQAWAAWKSIRSVA